MFEKLVIGSIIFLSITIFLCIIRAVNGPRAEDRLIVVNVISTKTIVLIALISLAMKENYFMDVALVYALISFLASVVIGEYLDKRREG